MELVTNILVFKLVLKHCVMNEEAGTKTITVSNSKQCNCSKTRFCNKPL